MRIAVAILSASFFIVPSWAQSPKAKNEPGPSQTAGSAQTTPEPAKSAPLTNADVVALLSEKISADIVIAQIHRATAVAFDLSTTGLVSLKRQNAPDAIVKAMMARQDSKGPIVDPAVRPPAPATPAVASQPGTPQAVSESRWSRVKGRLKSGNKMYVPVDDTVRAPKQASQVVLLEKEPTDRPFKVIGIIAPPADEYESVAEALNGIRKAAAKYGADAVFVVSESTESKSGFDVGMFGGGSTTEQRINLRAKAIIWQ